MRTSFSLTESPSRRKFLGGIAAGAAVAGLPALGRAATLAEIKQKGVLTAASEDDYQPFNFYQDNVFTGYNIELLHEIEKQMPFKVNDLVMPWAGILPGVTTGKYDVAVTAILITKDRLQALDFTTPVAESVDYYLKRTNDKTINSVKDLSGKRVGVEAGSMMATHLTTELAPALKKMGGRLGPVTQYQAYPEAYQDLAVGRLDYVANVKISLQSVANARPKVFTLGQAISTPSYMGWAIQKGNVDLLSYFNALLLATRKDGSMYRLQQKWFGSTFENMPEQPVAL